MAIDTTIFDGVSDELLGFWRTSSIRLQRTIVSTVSTPFQVARAELLLEQVNAEIANLQSRTNNWLRRVVPQAYQVGMDFTAAEMNLPILPATSLIDFRSVEMLIERVNADTGQALSSIAPNARRAYIDTQQEALAEQRLASMLAEERLYGKGPAALARTIREALTTGATDKLRGVLSDDVRGRLTEIAEGKHISILCRDGKVRRYTMKYYSELVARTAPRFAATEGAIRRTMAAGGDLVQWSVHVNPCVPICAPLQGKVFSITGRTPGFPILTDDTKPPGHPNCRHILLGIDPDFMRARGVYDGLREFSGNPERQVDSIAGFTRMVGEFASQSAANAAAASVALRPKQPPQETEQPYAT